MKVIELTLISMGTDHEDRPVVVSEAECLFGFPDNQHFTVTRDGKGRTQIDFETMSYLVKESYAVIRLKLGVEQ